MWFHRVQSRRPTCRENAAIAPLRLGRVPRQLRQVNAGVDVLLRRLRILVPSLSHHSEEGSVSAVRTKLAEICVPRRVVGGKAMAIDPRLLHCRPPRPVSDSWTRR